MGGLKLNGSSNMLNVSVNPEDQTILSLGKVRPVKELDLAAPVKGTVYGVLLNNNEDLDAYKISFNEKPYDAPPKAPVLYIKPRNTYSGHLFGIPVPEKAEELSMGGALGVVISKKASNVAEVQAMNYVAGYTIVNDVSIPHKDFYRPAVNKKARDGFCPMGPWILEKDAVNDVHSLTVSVFINNELKQKTYLNQMVRSVSGLIAEISEFMTLNEGDVVLVGVSSNPPLAKIGDTVTIKIEEIGELENKLVPELEWMAGVKG
ncbi:fumarylacetoacetate hydrolase family protein [Heyndrickxia acidicola]|uniref:Fumarylacetoacetate hydrolase family protein n=1 Tax=Heyndrickxia acidicola TaxID=209389 RepID=A0ABU6MBE9_9BACI|nr:fumarylacetoacetate hydrolase family protein [Heyndrickxia acidicola]MED1201584.1 fumarylacetoacetate hydrolase family protein [Heyndrickxia acidicola]